jgi:ubiquinone biosynthesis protein
MEKAIKERVSAHQIGQDLRTHFLDIFRFAKNLPRDMKELLNRISRNKFKIDLEHRGLDRFIQELDKSMNRLSSSMIISALLIGSSIVMQTDKGPQLFGFPFLAFLGYTSAVLIGLWWVIAIIRSGRL